MQHTIETVSIQFDVINRSGYIFGTSAKSDVGCENLLRKPRHMHAASVFFNVVI